MGTLIFGITDYVDTACLLTKGTNSYAGIVNPTWANDTAGSWSFWVRVNTLLATSTFSGVCCMGKTTTANQPILNFGIRRNAGLPTSTDTYFDITMRLTTGGTNLSGSSPTPVAASTWYHIVFGSDAKMYVNGVQQTLTFWSAGPLTANWYGDFVSSANKVQQFGASLSSGSPANFFDGKINNALYFNRVLTGTEVAEIYNAGMDGDPAYLSSYSSAVAQYDFENVYTDTIGGQTLTPAGSAPHFDTP